MFFLLFLLDDRMFRIRDAQNIWILRIRIRNTASNGELTVLCVTEYCVRS
jgi:hypothetical protein